MLKLLQVRPGKGVATTLLAAILWAFGSVSHGTVVSQAFTFEVVSSPISLYQPGHIFQITTSFDDAGTSANIWSDGANGVAEFGGGDDTLQSTLLLGSLAALSNATTSISGLLVPAGLNVFDPFPNASGINYSLYYSNGNSRTLDLATDGYSFVFAWLVQGGQVVSSNFFLRQYFVNDDGSPTQINAGILTRTVTSVPEPGSIALLGIGAAAFGVYCRNRRRKSC